MSDNTESKEVKESEEQAPIPKKSERSCRYVVDPCGCYVDPGWMGDPPFSHNQSA